MTDWHRIERIAAEQRVASAIYSLVVAAIAAFLYEFIPAAMRDRILFGLVCLMLVGQAQTLLVLRPMAGSKDR